MRRVAVELGPRGYDIVVGRGLLADVADHVPVPEGARRTALVTQATVGGYARTVADSLGAAGIEVTTIEVPEGEPAKDLAVLGRLYRELADIPLGRSDLVVAVGGGVVGDLAGFLAATWNRGVPVVQVPTTLLAQVDAAIGGKTGVNLPEGKNLVGAFHQPLVVVADVDVLATLPERERVAGLGEVVKYGLISDPQVLALLEDDPEAAVAGDADLLEELVQRSAAVKAEVVSADERESGRRAHLNLGHTYGHALESVTGYRRFLHGEAVAVGTCVALRLGGRIGVTPGELVPRTERLLERLGLPTRAPTLDREEVWSVMARDKKARDGVRFVVLEELGRPTVITPSPDDVDAAIDEVEVSP